MTILIITSNIKSLGSGHLERTKRWENELREDGYDVHRVILGDGSIEGTTSQAELGSLLAASPDMAFVDMREAKWLIDTLVKLRIKTCVIDSNDKAREPGIALNIKTIPFIEYPGGNNGFLPGLLEWKKVVRIYLSRPVYRLP